MSLYMHLFLPKNGRGLKEEMEKAGREGDHTIFYLVRMFELKSCGLAQTGTEIKYTSRVKFSRLQIGQSQSDFKNQF